jgi:hypothetical protein
MHLNAQSPWVCILHGRHANPYVENYVRRCVTVQILPFFVRLVYIHCLQKFVHNFLGAHKHAFCDADMDFPEPQHGHQHTRT